MLAAWSLLLYFLSPEEIATSLGAENAYLLLAILACIGGTSLFFPFPYYLFTITFGAAGLNPLLLGLAAGTGTLLGDTTSYYIALRGRAYVPERITTRVIRIIEWSESKHPALLPLFALLYTSLMPLPEDILMMAAGVAKYPFSRLAPVVWCGKIIFNTILALAGWYGWSFILNLV